MELRSQKQVLSRMRRKRDGQVRKSDIESKTVENRVKALEKSKKVEEEGPVKVASPSLARLQDRNVRGEHVTAIQRELIAKHHEAKSTVDKVGGGVSLWPSMDDMRLSRTDVVFLTIICSVLVTVVYLGFYAIHGSTISKLTSYTDEVKHFHESHPLVFRDNTSFQDSVLSWHHDFVYLMKRVNNDLSYSWSKASVIDSSLCLLYTFGIIILLWYLYDNVLSKSYLTPKRIKTWISLLAVVVVWTTLGLVFLVKARMLEDAVQEAVKQLTREMEQLVGLPLDLSHYKIAVLHWTVLYLPPTAPGILSIFGIIQVNDVVYFMQYYSLPILMAIVLPIVKVIASLKTVYSQTML